MTEQHPPHYRGFDRRFRSLIDDMAEIGGWNEDEPLTGKTTLDGKLYRLTGAIVDCWVATKHGGAHRWLRVVEPATVERVIAAVRAQSQRATG